MASQLTMLEESQEALELPACFNDEIAVLAYRLWQERGCPIGSPEVDWFKAELELSDPSRASGTAAYAMIGK